MYYTFKCNHAPTPVYAINGVIYYGSDLKSSAEFKGQLMVNFTSQPDIQPSLLHIPELAKHLELPFKEVMVPWPDMGSPYVKPEFWRALHAYVLKNKYEHVCFHCHAGHGRTGTALSAMLIANAGYAAPDAVEFVREQYCGEAVESFNQTAYLKQLDTMLNKNKYGGDTYKEEPLPSTIAVNFMASDDTNMGVDNTDDTEEINMIEDDDEEEKKIIFD